MYRVALILLTSNIFNSLMMFMRTLLIARLLGVEEYGIAATFAVSMTAVEALTAFGLQHLLVQDTGGEDPKLQAGVQGLHILRSFLSGIFLLLLARPYAAFLGLEDYTWAYSILALAPVLMGFMHFDHLRMNRKFVFLPSILTTSVPALVSVLLVWPLFFIFGDYRVMLYALLAQAVIGLVTSHLVAVRPYRLSFDMAILRKAFRFGWPLLISSVLMFAVFHGEKLIVGRVLGIEQLAIFAMASTLTLTPALMLYRTAHTFFLPQLSAAKDDPPQFAHLFNVTCQTHIFFGAFLVIAVILFGAPVLTALLGTKYAAAIPYLPWLAILASFYLIKVASVTIALAQARNEVGLIGNLPRVILLPVAYYVAVRTDDIFQIIWIGILAEFLGIIVSFALLRYILKFSPSWPVSIAAMAFMLAATVHISVAPNPAEIYMDGTLAATFALFGLLAITLKSLRKFMIHQIVFLHAD
jgi:O-antigen/teichoic acid export membrane protein